MFKACFCVALVCGSVPLAVHHNARTKKRYWDVGNYWFRSYVGSHCEHGDTMKFHSNQGHSMVCMITMSMATSHPRTARGAIVRFEPVRALTMALFLLRDVDCARRWVKWCVLRCSSVNPAPSSVTSGLRVVGCCCTWLGRRVSSELPRECRSLFPDSSGIASCQLESWLQLHITLAINNLPTPPSCKYFALRSAQGRLAQPVCISLIQEPI